MPAVDSEQLFYTSQSSTLHHLSDHAAIKMSWFGEVDREPFQETYKSLCAALQEKDAKWVIADERNMTGVSTKGRMWLVTKFGRREGKIALSRVQRIAIIKARSVFASTVTKLMYKTLQSIAGFEYEYFDDEDQALRWLAQ